MATFVHTADIHLDTPFAARFTKEQASLRRKEVMQTFQHICETARQADLFFISGDLFDGRFVSSQTVAFLKRCFAQMPDTRVFIAAGNHDPLSRDSAYLAEHWGDNVHIFEPEMEYVDIPELQIRIHGCSFEEPYQEKTLLSALTLKMEWANLLVMHGELVSAGGESAYNPIEKQALMASGVEYAALGHIHLYQGIERQGTVYYAYPGIPEGRGFDEIGEKGFISGKVEKGSLHAEWHPVSARKFLCKELDVSDCSDGLMLLAQLENAIEKDGQEHCYRLILTGEAETGLIEIEVLTKQLQRKAFYVELKDRTKPKYKIEDLASEPGLRGAFVAAMLKEIDNLPSEEKKIGEAALYIGLSAMDKGVQG